MTRLNILITGRLTKRERHLIDVFTGLLVQSHSNTPVIKVNAKMVLDKIEELMKREIPA